MANIVQLMKKAIEHPDKIITNLGRRGYLNWMTDESYIKLLYWSIFKEFPDLSEPKTYNEKIQWLKLYDRRPEYTTWVDKYAVKEHVAGIIGREHVIPTLGIWESFDKIDFEKLPEKFVLKCTHDSGSVVICTDKKQMNLATVRKKMEKGLKQNFFYFGREWVYKDVKPRIIAEQYMVDESGVELKDYKFFCFNGEPRIIQVDYNRFVKHKRNLYSIDWEFIDAEIEFPSDRGVVIEKPALLEDMLFFARQLSKDIPHVRVDFYVIEGRVFFGEMTFYHGSGMEHFRPAELNTKLGDWIDLPVCDKGKTVL